MSSVSLVSQQGVGRMLRFINKTRYDLFFAVWLHGGRLTLKIKVSPLSAGASWRLKAVEYRRLEDYWEQL